MDSVGHHRMPGVKHVSRQPSQLCVNRCVRGQGICVFGKRRFWRHAGKSLPQHIGSQNTRAWNLAEGMADQFRYCGLAGPGEPANGDEPRGHRFEHCARQRQIGAGLLGQSFV